MLGSLAYFKNCVEKEMASSLTQQCEGLLGLHHVRAVVHTLDGGAASRARVIKFFRTP